MIQNFQIWKLVLYSIYKFQCTILCNKDYDFTISLCITITYLKGNNLTGGGVKFWALYNEIKKIMNIYLWIIPDPIFQDTLSWHNWCWHLRTLPNGYPQTLGGNSHQSKWTHNRSLDMSCLPQMHLGVWRSTSGNPQTVIGNFWRR